MMRHRVNILGVGINALDMEMALQTLDAWLARREPHYRRVSGFRHMRHVSGPDLMLAVCERSALQGYRHFFYGGAAGVADKLANRLQDLFPVICIAGTYCPPLRSLTPEEDVEMVEQINMAQPDIIWIGLRTPHQERWIAAYMPFLSAPVLVGVGAAFDRLARVQQQTPHWMQCRGLAWLCRPLQEPQGLWRRGLINNPRFLWRLLRAAFGRKRDKFATPSEASARREEAQENQVFS